MKNFIVLGCLVGFSRSALAVPTGVTGYSGKQGRICNDCHSGGNPPTVRLSGPGTLTVGEQREYKLTITGGSAVAGGLDVALSNSLAMPVVTDTTNTQIMTDPQSGEPELTHKRAITFPPGTTVLEVSFAVKALSPGTLTIYAAGNSTDNLGSESGDRASSDTFGITIEPIDGGAGTDAGNTDAGSTSADSGAKADSGTTGPRDLSTTQPDQGHPKPISSDGCAVGGHSPPTSAALLFGFALVLLVRRRLRSIVH